MPIKIRFYALLLLSFLPYTASASAQQNASAAAQAPEAIHLDVVVTAKSGPPVTGLRQQDFTILDNKASRPITSFQAVSGSQAPVEIVLVVDGVNTPYMRLAYARGEIEKALRANGGHLPHPISLAIFTDTGTQIQNGPSTDGNALSTVLDQSAIGLRSIRRSSGIYGADERVQLSLDTLQRLIAREATRPGRKAILWLSPGWPLLSGPHINLGAKQQRQIYNEAIGLSTAMRRADITLYSVDPSGAGESLQSSAYYYQEFLKGIDTPNDAQLGNLSLQVLAAQSGGLVLNANNDISALLQRCIADTGAWYELSFDPPPAERAHEYHHLEIKVTNPALTARTRLGYYSQP